MNAVPRDRRRDERGLTLVECAAALTVAALVLVSTARAGQAAAGIVRRTRLQAEALDVVRGLLEHELGAPCGAPPPCPDGWNCRVTRAALTAAADHVSASAQHQGDGAAEQMSTLAPAPACGS